MNITSGADPDLGAPTVASGAQALPIRSGCRLVRVNGLRFLPSMERREPRFDHCGSKLSWLVETVVYLLDSVQVTSVYTAVLIRQWQMVALKKVLLCWTGTMQTTPTQQKTGSDVRK